MNYKRKNIKKRSNWISNLLLWAIILASTSNCFAQAQDFNSPKSKPSANKFDLKFDPDRLVFGGNLGANFGNITTVEIAPTVGYLMSDNYLVGLSGRYIYYEDRRFAPIFKTNIYGGGIFNQYFILENIILHAEYEVLNLQSSFSGERTNISSVFVGGGYRSDMGGTSYFSILLLYNLNETIDSPYNDNPILRVGFGISLF